MNNAIKINRKMSLPAMAHWHNMRIEEILEPISDKVINNAL